ncbi:MAG: general secretion pathway protein GspB [Candidatus Rokuibacteriota bacterium]
MSYILDALTKAAQQRDRQAPVVQRLLAPAPRARSRWSYASGRFLGALALNAVLLSLVLFWWLRPVPAPIPAPQEPVAAPAPSPASPRPLVKLEPLPTTDPSLEKPAPTTLGKPSSATVAKPASPAEPRADAAPTAPKPSALSASPRVGTPTIQPTPAPPAAARPAAPQESGLRLEALIYSDTPGERMVFINGRRYREGDSIDGRLRIEEIREDGAELSDQGRRFTLRVTR